jgi:hypothetical protein
MQIVKPFFNIKIDENIKVQHDNLLKLIDNKSFIYKDSKGIFIPDHMNFDGKNKTYGSLTNNISIANNLYSLYLQTDNYMYLQNFKKIMAYISNNKESFVKNNGDLYKGIKEINGKICGYGEDDSDITLISLLKLQIFLIEVDKKEDTTLVYLINKKITYLKKKGIELASEKDKLAHEKASTLYQKLNSIKRNI